MVVFLFSNGLLFLQGGQSTYGDSKYVFLCQTFPGSAEMLLNRLKSATSDEVKLTCFKMSFEVDQFRLRHTL